MASSNLARAITRPLDDGSATDRPIARHCTGCSSQQRPRRRPAKVGNDVGPEAQQFCHTCTGAVQIATAEAKVDSQVAAFDPAKAGEGVLKSRQLGRRERSAPLWSKPIR